MSYSLSKACKVLGKKALLTVFIRLNDAAFIEFFLIQVRRLYEGGVYLKSNLFLVINSRVIEHLNFKKQKHVLVVV